MINEIIDTLNKNNFRKTSEFSWVKNNIEIIILDDKNISIADATLDNGKIYHGNGNVDYKIILNHLN